MSDPDPAPSPDPGGRDSGSAGADEVGWLVREGEVLASVELAESRKARLIGLLGRSQFNGALVLPQTRSVHTMGMDFDLDVAWVDDDNIVVRTLQLKRNRITLPQWRARLVIEAQAGSFGTWELKIGDKVEVRRAQ